MSSTRKINATKDYRMFTRSSDNRPTDIKKHRKLEGSMKEYGFLQSFPIVCFRDANKHLVVKDGQHRLTIAETLGLTVYWVEETVDFDVAKINCTSKIWGLKDYAQKFAANGIASYREGLDFAEAHGLPVGTAFSLLAGNTNYSNIEGAFTDGTFKVKDRKWADAVAGVYVPLVEMAPTLKNARFIEACMSCCRVESFDQKRLLENVRRCREKLVPYSTRDAYLDMLEVIYNFGRNKLVGLKAEATMAMRERSACEVAKNKKAAKSGKEAA